MPYKRVLISGGAGFIGSATARALLERGVNVRVLDNLLPQVHGAEPARSPTYASIRNDVEFIHGDVRDNDAWKQALEGCEAVVHLAALTGTGQSMYRIQEYSQVNIDGTAALLQQLTVPGHSVDRIVVASSRSIYGEGKYVRPSDRQYLYPGPRNVADLDAGRFGVYCTETGEELQLVPTDEASRTSPASIYAVSKLTQEQMVLTACGALGIGSIALRYQNVYGPGQSLANPYTGILSVFSTAILENREINVFEDGLPARDFVYIDDVAKANVAALEAPNASGLSINIGTGVPTTVLDALQALAASIGKPPLYRVTGNYRVGDIRACVADQSAMRAMLQIDTPVPFPIGCARFVTWALENVGASVATTSYSTALAEMQALRLMR